MSASSSATAGEAAKPRTKSLDEIKSALSRVRQTTGSFTFRIDGFSGLPNAVGASTESPEFVLCGHTWQLRIFPGGSLQLHRNFVSFYLASKSDKVARASYTLTVKNQVVGGTDEQFASTAVRTFEPKGVQIDGWGRDKFMSVAMLSDSDAGFQVDDQ